MANKNDDNEQDRNSETPTLTPVLINLPDLSNQIGGIIQPVNPHFSGHSVVADIETEDPDVQWIPNPGFVAVMIAEEEAVPLTADDIAAVNFASERTPSTASCVHI